MPQNYPRRPALIPVSLDAATVQKLMMFGMLRDDGPYGIVTTDRGEAWIRKLFVRAVRAA